MKHIREALKKYLTLAGVEDAVEQGEFDFSTGGTKFVPLAEHDKKYHPDGYEQGDECNKREEMEEVDPVDTDIKNGAAKQPMSEDEKEAQWVYQLRHMSDDRFGDVIQKYAYEDKYPKLYKLIKAERDRRAKMEMHRWYRENGERA